MFRLKIVVVDGGRVGSYKSKNAGVEKSEEKTYKNSPLYKLLNARQTIKNKVKSGMTPSSVMAMNMGLGVAGQFVKQTANYYLSDIGRQNGDSNYQNMITKRIGFYSDILGLASGALSGAATGSMFGIGGAGVGLIMGATSSAISTVFKQAEAKREYQHEMFKQETSQQYALTRANYSIYAGRKF